MQAVWIRALVLVNAALLGVPHSGAEADTVLWGSDATTDLVVGPGGAWRAMTFELARPSPLGLLFDAETGATPHAFYAYFLLDETGDIDRAGAFGSDPPGAGVGSSLLAPEPIYLETPTGFAGTSATALSLSSSADPGRYTLVAYVAAEHVRRLHVDVAVSIGAGTLLGTSEGADVFAFLPRDGAPLASTTANALFAGAHVHVGAESAVDIQNQIVGYFGPVRGSPDICELRATGPQGALGGGCRITIASATPGEYRFRIDAYADVGASAGSPAAHGADWTPPLVA